MKRIYSAIAAMAASSVMIYLSYLLLRPSGLQRTIELFQNFFAR